MGTGINPSEATAMSISKIAKFYPDFSGALIAVNTTGGYGMFIIRVSYCVYPKSNSFSIELGMNLLFISLQPLHL